MRLRPYLDLLRRNPAFARLYAAQLISFAGDWFATVALLGLALDVSGSSAVASLVLVLQIGPFFVASPIAGVLADRLDRRRLMLAADFARAGIALLFLVARDASTFWVALLGVALLSVGSAFFEPTSSASLPNLVDDEDLPTANVLIGSAWGTMLAVGAAIGGVVAALLGRDAAFVLNAASFLLSGLLILGIRRPFRQPRADAAALGGEGGGIAAVTDALHATIRLARSSQTIAALLLSKTTFGVGFGAVFLLAVFADSVYGAGDVGIGLLFAARGLGALIGPFLARSLTGPGDGGLLAAIGLSLVGYIAAYLLLPLAPTIWVAVLLVFAAHLGGGAQWTLSTYGLQRVVPDAIRGRVFSFDYALLTLTLAASTLAAGALSSSFGPQAALWTLLAVATLAAAGWLAWTRPLWRTGPAEVP